MTDPLIRRCPECGFVDVIPADALEAMGGKVPPFECLNFCGEDLDLDDADADWSPED